MSADFIEKLKLTRKTIEGKQSEIDKVFDSLVEEYSITNDYVKDAIYDYCYNDFESPILTNFLAELNEPD